jgi:hypothetical protein
MPHYGFNFLWMFIWERGRSPQPVDERALDFLTAFDFNFVRIPMDYRFWTSDFAYYSPDESIFKSIDSYLQACQARKIHLSLNIHRAPGYCINRNDLEKHNLWLDKEAQDAFVFQWEVFARRYMGIPAEALSFDLLNEPPDIGQYGLTRENHAALIRRTVAAIRNIDPQREIVIDGLGGGNIAMPELADMEVIHSGRGYQPMPVSHHQAWWWDEQATAPDPEYPGLLWMGHHWDFNTLRDYYMPWRAVNNLGVKIHIGEMGCYQRTPHLVAIRWLRDLFSIYSKYGWGYALWNFDGEFGIMAPGREDVHRELLYGYQVDREMLNLMLENRIS